MFYLFYIILFINLFILYYSTTWADFLKLISMTGHLFDIITSFLQNIIQ